MIESQVTLPAIHPHTYRQFYNTDTPQGFYANPCLPDLRLGRGIRGGTSSAQRGITTGIPELMTLLI